MSYDASILLKFTLTDVNLLVLVYKLYIQLKISNLKLGYETMRLISLITENIKVAKTGSDAPRLCPYLDTINRQFLDFDFEKLCSVSLSRINVYACLVCGKYFQGRGTNTHAYTHSVAESHHVFLNLHTLKFYCLPDNYEIIGKEAL